MGLVGLMISSPRMKRFSSLKQTILCWLYAPHIKIRGSMQTVEWLALETSGASHLMQHFLARRALY